MRNLTDPMRRIWMVAIGAAVLSILPALAEGASPVNVEWEGLSMVVGKTVMVSMPDGGIITGKAVGVESDALLVNVAKTTDPKAWPKGALRVPRETLRVLEMRTKGKAFRVLGTLLGAGAGFVVGGLAAWNISPLFDTKNQGKAEAAFFGILTGASLLGYFAGNAADARWTIITVEIRP